MPLKILIAPDKFKGTLTAEAAARSIARGWRQARPADHLEMLPISDGGEGFGEVLGLLLGAKRRKVRTVDAARRRRTIVWRWDPQTRTAVVESASVVGLSLFPAGKPHPFKLDTFGLGAVLRAAYKAGAHHCFVGLGGSATNDGGFGLARSLGWEFIDRQGAAIKEWTALEQLHSLRAPRRHHRLYRLSAVVDVQNPLLGQRGATRVYGPQKGLRRQDFALAERCLRRLALVCRRHFGEDYAHQPGAGAAGGLGFGFRAFANATIVSGFELLAERSGLEHRLARADLVITGEGRIDKSTMMGKAVGQIALRCRELRIPCLALAGQVSGNAASPKEVFQEVHVLESLTRIKQARIDAAHWLESLATRAARTCPDLA